MTYEEYKQRFEAKTGDPCLTPDGFTVYYLPDRGFAEFAIHTGWNMLFVYNVCGDGKFWFDVAKLLCKVNGLKYLTTITAKNVIAHARLFGFRNPVQEDNLIIFTNDNGEKAIYKPEYVHQGKQYWSAMLEVSNV